MFIRAIAETAELFVAVTRLQEFLLKEEFHAINCSDSSIKGSDMDIQIQNITAAWNSNSLDNTLTNINLTVAKGNMLGVVGPVGSGKSSLLQTILSRINHSLL